MIKSFYATQEMSKNFFSKLLIVHLMFVIFFKILHSLYFFHFNRISEEIEKDTPQKVYLHSPISTRLYKVLISFPCAASVDSLSPCI